MANKSKLDSLTEKRDQLNAQIQAIKAKEQAQKRKDDTRRKVLIGGVIMKRVKDGKMPYADLKSLLNEELTKDNDRALFELEKLHENEAPSRAKK